MRHVTNRSDELSSAFWFLCRERLLKRPLVVVVVVCGMSGLACCSTQGSADGRNPLTNGKDLVLKSNVYSNCTRWKIHRGYHDGDRSHCTDEIYPRFNIICAPVVLSEPCTWEYLHKLSRSYRTSHVQTEHKIKNCRQKIWRTLALYLCLITRQL